MLDPAQNVAPDRWGSRDGGWSAVGGCPVSPRGRLGHWCLVSAWRRLPLLAPTWGGHSTPRFDASLLQTTSVTSAERPGASPAGELGHAGDSAYAWGSARAWGLWGQAGAPHSCSGPQERRGCLRPAPRCLTSTPLTQEVCSLWTVGTVPYVCLENENTGSLPRCLHQFIPRLFLKT